VLEGLPFLKDRSRTFQSLSCAGRKRRAVALEKDDSTLILESLPAGCLELETWPERTTAWGTSHRRRS